MDKAKDSLKKFVGKSGQHDTTIHEQVAPHVQHEQVEHRHHENVMPAVDREIHQDHYHTSEQPIHHSEQLPEQHHHRAVPVEERSFEHGSDDAVKRRLEEERAKYQHHSERVEGEHTRSTEAAIEGERVHHHVHENIQPIVQKQTVEPHVYHTTVPVHEVHHNEAKHHGATALPAVSMDEFKKHGGSLQGREEVRDHFSGEPRHFTDGGAGGHSGGGLTGQSGSGLTGHSGSTGVGNNASQYESRLDPGRDHTSSTTGTTSSTGKPSLLDKLNPKKDTDGDGKAGLMD